MNQYIGALKDKKDIRDFKRSELAKATMPMWKEKTSFKSYPVRDQDGSYSCVAQSVATLLGALIEKKDGKYIEVSAKPIYTKRTNKSEGMYFREAMQIGAEYGSTFEVSVPSQKIGEDEMNDVSNITDIDLWIAGIVNGLNYFSVAYNFNEIASILEEGNPLIVGNCWDYDEWDTEFPTIKSNSSKKNHHCTTIVDYALIGGKKYLIQQDSWGKNKGKNGLRFLNEDWISRMTGCWYYDELDYQQKEVVKVEKFNVDLEYGMISDDVKRLQEFLKDLGIFPQIECTRYYGAITLRAVKDFQLKNGIISSSDDLGAGRCGPKTRAIINNYK